MDGTSLKVFQYTLSGSSIGCWAIDPANSHPTGITIDPNNVSGVRIVDHGTDKVYLYLGGAGRTSGSQTAGATFALSAANVHPRHVGCQGLPQDLRVPADSVIYGMINRRSPTFGVSTTRGAAISAVLPPPTTDPQVAPLRNSLAPASLTVGEKPWRGSG